MLFVVLFEIAIEIDFCNCCFISTMQSCGGLQTLFGWLPFKIGCKYL